MFFFVVFFACSASVETDWTTLTLEGDCITQQEGFQTVLWGDFSLEREGESVSGEAVFSHDTDGDGMFDLTDSSALSGEAEGAALFFTATTPTGFPVVFDLLLQTDEYVGTCFDFSVAELIVVD